MQADRFLSREIEIRRPQRHHAGQSICLEPSSWSGWKWLRELVLGHLLLLYWGFGIGSLRDVRGVKEGGKCKLSHLLLLEILHVRLEPCGERNEIQCLNIDPSFARGQINVKKRNIVI